MFALSVIIHPPGSNAPAGDDTGTGWSATAGGDLELPGRDDGGAAAHPAPQHAILRAARTWHVSVDGSVRRIQRIRQSSSDPAESAAGRHDLAQLIPVPAPVPQRLAVLTPASAAALLGTALQVQKSTAEPAPTSPGMPAPTTSTGTSAHASPANASATKASALRALQRKARWRTRHACRPPTGAPGAAHLAG